ncbi:MAG: hypothetical protein DHS20C08_06910 [Rhodomicrobium sp.]|nr:MAG: hypothetical protein DHS20C08_06910 [Rhodomicrobium sp.]
MLDGAEILDELQSLSNTKSSDSRRQLLHRITDLFEHTSDEQDESHNLAFDQIMDKLAYELETSVRAEFANRLADLPNAPTNVSQKFALDEIDVARPLLQKSKVLSDDFLIRVAQTKSQEHLMAISQRPDITTRVTDVLVDRGNERVLENVTSNKGANFSRKSFEKLTKHANENETLNNLLEGRADTPEDLLEIIKDQVTNKIREEAAEAGIDISSDEIRHTVDQKSASIEISEAEKQAALQEIDYLHKRKQLDERVVVHYVKLNKPVETIYCLSLMTDIDEPIVRHCLLQAELPALAVLCKSSGFQRSTFASLLQLRENLSDITGSQIVDAIRRYETLDLSTAHSVMRFLKVRKLAEQNAENNQEPQAAETTPPSAV